jgi:hypothetical protein
MGSVKRGGRSCHFSARGNSDFNNSAVCIPTAIFSGSGCLLYQVVPTHLQVIGIIYSMVLYRT